MAPSKRKKHHHSQISHGKLTYNDLLTAKTFDIDFTARKRWGPAPSGRRSIVGWGNDSFLDFPPEIRSMIYSLLIHHTEDKDQTLLSGARLVSPPTLSAMAATCRTIRAELLPMVYAACTVRTIVFNIDFSNLIAWLKKVALNPVLLSAIVTNNRSNDQNEGVLEIYLPSVRHTSLDSLYAWLRFLVFHPVGKQVRGCVAYALPGDMTLRIESGLFSWGFDDVVKLEKLMVDRRMRVELRKLIKGYCPSHAF